MKKAAGAAVSLSDVKTYAVLPTNEHVAVSVGFIDRSTDAELLQALRLAARAAAERKRKGKKT